MSAPHSDEKIENAKRAILRLFEEDNLQVAYDRELRYRLEGKFPHDVVGKAVHQLDEAKEIIRTSVPGRPGAGDMPNRFYKLPGSNYKELLPIMRKKLDLSIFITGVSGDMGRHAELAWWRAFKRNGWEVFPESEEQFKGVNEYKGRKSTTNHDIDFIATRDKIQYGVEVKNRLNYPDDLYWKFNVAVELDTIPLIVARWLNPAQLPLIPQLGGASPIMYKDAIYSTAYQAMIEDTRRILSLPIEARDEVDDEYFKKKMDKTHAQTVSTYDEKKKRLKEYMLLTRTNPKIRTSLGAQESRRQYP